jgi:hypothetical protein
MTTQMAEFKVVEGQVNGNVHVTTDTQFNDIKAEQLVIEENVRVRLYGTINDVILKKGSCLYLHGKIFGKISNEGGEIFTFYQ